MLSGLSHDPLLRDIFTPLWVGGTLCIPEPEEMLIPERFRHWMREQERHGFAHDPGVESGFDGGMER